MKIDDREIRELMRKALHGLIDKNDLTGTEKAHILYFAKQDKLNELDFLHKLLIANPKQKFENLVSYSTRLKDCDKLINWLDPVEIKNKTIIFDGAKQLQDDVNEYLNNWQSVTKDGLELRSRQIREALTYFKMTLSDPDEYNHIKTEDLTRLKQFIDIFELLAENIKIRLEKYNIATLKQPAELAKKKTEAVTYRWIKQSEKQLPELYRKLIDGGFIATETSSETFTACFSGQPVESITEKIKWLKSKALLAYFIDEIKNQVAFADWWLIAGYCFDNGSGLSNTRNQYLNSNTGKPRGYQSIDEVLTDL